MNPFISGLFQMGFFIGIILIVPLLIFKYIIKVISNL